MRAAGLSQHIALTGFSLLLFFFQHKATKRLFWSYQEPFKEIILSAGSLRQPDKSASLCGNVPEILLFHAGPKARRLLPHMTLSFFCFSELGAVWCCGHGLLNNCDSHLSGIR